MISIEELAKHCNGDAGADATSGKCWLLNSQLPAKLNKVQLQGEPIKEALTRLTLLHVYQVKKLVVEHGVRTQSTCKCCNPYHYLIAGDPAVNPRALERQRNAAHLQRKYEAKIEYIKSYYLKWDYGETLQQKDMCADLQKQAVLAERALRRITQAWDHKLEWLRDNGRLPK